MNNEEADVWTTLNRNLKILSKTCEIDQGDILVGCTLDFRLSTSKMIRFRPDKNYWYEASLDRYGKIVNQGEHQQGTATQFLKWLETHKLTAKPAA